MELGPDAGGDVEVVLAPLPAPEAVRAEFAALPIALDRAPLVFAGTEYPDPRTAFAGRLAAGQRVPERWLVAGRDPEAIARLGRRVVGRLLGIVDTEDHPAFGTADYLVSESPWVERIGSWRTPGVEETSASGGAVAGNGGSAAAPRIEPADAVDGFAERERWRSGLRRVDGGSAVSLLAPPASAGALEPLAAELGRAVSTMRRRLGAGPPGPPALEVAIETDHVAQVHHTDRLASAVAGGPADVHWVEHPDDVWALRHALAGRLVEGAGLAASRAGAPGEPLPWLDAGAALWLADGEWYGRPWRDWLPMLAAAGALPAADELLAAEEQAAGSAPLWVPAAAAVVDARAGETLAERLARPFGEAEVAAVLDRLARSPRPAAPARRARPADPFLAGVSFAMTNTVEGGYHAPRAAAELDRLRALGADAVALMPFAYQRHPNAPGLSFLNRRPRSETDAGVVHAARAADARGLTVLWKPHLWISHDSWPGEVEMPDEAAWAAWWRDYRRYVLHHALLAEYAGAEIFAVGVELERTVERPEWARLVADVRRLYGGAVTYAANWGEGAERFRFWPLLDYVGVDAYYPLAGAAEAGDAELEAGARAVVDRLAALAERAGRPLLLTEVGYPARRAAWVRPHEGDTGEYAPADQARAYRALFAALASDPGRHAVSGVFLWKAFSGPRPWDDAEDPDFRFLDRPAEREVERFFRRSRM